MVALHIRMLVGREWQHVERWVRAAAVIDVLPRFNDEGKMLGSRVLVQGECWLLVTERPADVIAALEQANA